MGDLSDTGVYAAIQTGIKDSMEEQLKPLKESLDEHKNAISGRANRPQEGLLYRMLSQEKLAKYLLTILGIFVTACIIAAVNNWVSELMAKGSG